MATLREIRTRIKSVKNIIKITSAMKLVAAAKMRRAQEAILAARPYAGKLGSILDYLVANLEDKTDPLLQQRDRINNIALIVVTADRGLCGGFNSNLLRFAGQHIKQVLNRDYPQANVHVIAVGRRGTSFYKARQDQYSIDETFPGIFNGLQFNDAVEISRLATDGFLVEKYDKVQLVFNEAVSTVRQQPIVRDFLPIVPSEESSAEAQASSVDYIVEPSLNDLLGSLLPKHLNMQVWSALLESNAAEHAARMMAMENATNNARDLNRDLELTYNKARQAAITTEILEVVSGADALKSA